MKKQKSKIAVAGDFSIDALTWPAKAERNDLYWENGQLPTLGTARMKGGALLLADLLRQKEDLIVLSQNVPDETKGILLRQLDVGLFPAGPGLKEKIYRLNQIRGFIMPESGDTSQLNMQNDDKGADLVVVFDEGKGFLQDPSKWPKALKAEASKPVVIYRMSASPSAFESLGTIAAQHVEKTVVVVEADALRHAGVNISRGLSWERTVMELQWQLRYNHKLQPLLKCFNLVVVFGNEAAVCFRQNAKEMQVVLIYNPQSIEGGNGSGVLGDMPDASVVFTTALAAEIAESLKNGRNLGDAVETGAKSGLAAARRYLAKGYGSAAGIPTLDLKGIIEPNDDSCSWLARVSLPRIQAAEEPDPAYWCIVKKLDGISLDKIGTEIVREGQGAILKQVPSARFGKLCTIDRTEIESFRSISNLLSEYLKNERNARPLSIAVFGSPGSGKSFGVSEIADQLAPGLVVKLEFNMSQFLSEGELAVAFHKVRDVVLKGKIPLVFFDEFDTAYQGKLGWLKSFLAPMQDGAFKEGESMHPIGNAIFVFAGGTSNTFQAFCGDLLKDEEKEPWLKEFKEAKGPDFVSRLRGFVNIMGPNPTNERDNIFILRRAMLLRSLLERKAGQLFDLNGIARIDEGIVSALLHIRKYRHGARSMESIIDMSRLEGSDCWEPSSLPIKEQLSIHVDSEEFMRIVLMDVLLAAAREKIARSIHDEYRKAKAAAGEKKDPAQVPYDQLPESLKDSCRASASDIYTKLQKSGLGIRPTLGDARIFQFSQAELNEMSKEEHNRFVEERVAAGWRLGPVKDLEQLTSPYLVPWEKLDETAKELDRSSVRNIPKLLANAGFEIVRIE